MSRGEASGALAHLASGPGTWNSWQEASVNYPLDMRLLFPAGRIEGVANLNQYRFSGRVLFDGLRVPSDFHFDFTEFHGVPSFLRTVFEGRVYFLATAFPAGVNFLNARFRDCPIFAGAQARVWPKGPVCPHCGGVERNGKMGGNSTRIGTCKCYDCRKPFTVKVGTIFESSHIPLRLWLQAIFLIASSKKGISSNQLHRTLCVTLKSAWFMSHRIRLAMDSTDEAPFGQSGGSVEVDETFLGTDATKPKPKNGPAQKRKVLSLIDRNRGRARSMDNLKSKTLIPSVV